MHEIRPSQHDNRVQRQREGREDSQFGAVRSTCMHAARAIGPRGQCGANATSYVSVYDASRCSSLIPPQCATCITASVCRQSGYQPWHIKAGEGTNIRLRDVDSAALEVGTEVVAREEPLPERDGCRDHIGKVRDLLRLRGQQRLYVGHSVRQPKHHSAAT